MIQSYFFIPGKHPKLLQKLKTINADHFIIDLEDSISYRNTEAALRSICKINNKEQIWIRPRLFINRIYDLSLIQKLIDLKFTNYVIPKIRSIEHINELEKIVDPFGYQNFDFILLVENAECLLNLPYLLKKTKLQIFGIGFGSQDYCSETGIKNSLEYLMMPRFFISNTAKAFGLKCIDVVSMDLDAKSSFVSELRESVNLGFDGKFIIHPKQLEALQNFAIYSPDEVSRANEILDAYYELGEPAIFVFQGKAIESSHIKECIKIKQWGDRYGKK